MYVCVSSISIIWHTHGLHGAVQITEDALHMHACMLVCTSMGTCECVRTHLRVHV